MTDRDFSLLLSVVAKQLEALAGMRATADTLAELIAKIDGEDSNAVLHRMSVLQKKYHEEALLELDRSDPELAARLDLRTAQDASDAASEESEESP